jgi:hypothetical protein
MELHINWIADAITHLRRQGKHSIEVLQTTQDEWIDLITSMVQGTLLLHPTCNSWWNNSNVPGKKRVYTTYVAGMPAFREHCDEAAASGYAGFALN